MKLRIKRIDPSSLAGTLGAIYFLIACVMSVLGLILASTGIPFTFSGWLNVSGTVGASSVLMMLLNPVIAGVSGLISGLLIAFLYNFVARYTLGVGIETEENRHFL